MSVISSNNPNIEGLNYFIIFKIYFNLSKQSFPKTSFSCSYISSSYLLLIFFCYFRYFFGCYLDY